MSEQIREQVSAFLDGELPGSEAELLLKRLTRDGELRDRFGRYALIGECLRGGTGGRLSQGFAARINQVIDGEPLPAAAAPRIGAGAASAWWRPFAGVAVAAGVAAVAVAALQHRATEPSPRESLTAAVSASGAGAAQVVPARAVAPAAVMLAQDSPGGLPREQISYTTPVAAGEAPAGSPGARLTNYVFMHSNYSWGLGHSNFIDLLADGDAPDAAGAMNAAVGAGDASATDGRANRGPSAAPARIPRRDP